MEAKESLLDSMGVY